MEIQTAAMALRFVISLDRYEYAHCTQHEQTERLAASTDTASDPLEPRT